MELTVGIAIWQFLFHVHYASDFEAPGHAGVFPDESLLSVPDNEFRARFRLVGHQVLLCCQVTLTVGVGVWIRAAIRQFGEQVPLVIVWTESALLLLHGVHLKKNSQIYCHA